MLIGLIGDGNNDGNNHHMFDSNDGNRGTYNQHNVDDNNILKHSINQEGKILVFKSGANRMSKLP